MSLCRCLQQKGLHQDMDPDRLDIEGDEAGPSTSNDDIIYMNDEVDFLPTRAHGVSDGVMCQPDLRHMPSRAQSPRLPLEMSGR